MKELIENALDAGAQHISVDVEHAGRQLICVTDDGAGIEPEDVPLAFELLATGEWIDAPRDLSPVRTWLPRRGLAQHCGGITSGVADPPAWRCPGDVRPC